MAPARAGRNERREIVGFDDPPDPDNPYEFQPPGGLFVVAYSSGGDPIVCGGYRTYLQQTAVVEVRKMYVGPRSRPGRRTDKTRPGPAPVQTWLLGHGWGEHPRHRLIGAEHAG